MFTMTKVSKIVSRIPSFQYIVYIDVSKAKTAHINVIWLCSGVLRRFPTLNQRDEIQGRGSWQRFRAQLLTAAAFSDSPYVVTMPYFIAHAVILFFCVCGRCLRKPQEAKTF